MAASLHEEIDGGKRIVRMSSRNDRYVEHTPWPHWAAAVFWGAFVLTGYAILAGWDMDVPVALRIPIATALMLAALALRLVVAGLTVRVDDSGLFLHLGAVPLLHRRVSFDEVIGLDVVRYRPIREFGGWGIRGWGKKKAWTARGNQAVRLRLSDDRELYIGSDVPRRLAERIRTIGRIEGSA